MRRGTLIGGVLLALLAGIALPASAAALPQVKHVWVVVLENENYDATFGEGSKATYLAQELPKQGQLLTQYYATTHLSLGNYIALVSGQASNPQTQSDCQFFTDFQPGTIGADGQAIGTGCVYPSHVLTVADQLEAKGLTWRGYMEDMKTPCRHPEVGARDDTQSAEVGDQYATRHNPFVYFHSLIDRPTCAQNDVPLEQLTEDLKSAATSPSFGFVTPNLCNDGHDAPCVDGQPGGPVSADAFLRKWVPRITGSPAYRDGGVLIVTFDEAEGEPGHGDASACCNQQPGPNTPNPGGLVPGPGGGRVGAVVLSGFVKPGSVNDTPYNHYSLLRSVEDLYGLDHLGYAGQAGLRPFGEDVFGIATAGRGSTKTARAPTARFGGLPQSCVGGMLGFRYSVGTRAIARVRVQVDGKTVRTLTQRRAGVSLGVRSLKAGRHTLRVVVTATSGKSGRATTRFTRCG